MSTEPAAPIDVTARYYSENGALVFRGKTYYPVDYVFTRNDIRQAKAEAWGEGAEYAWQTTSEGFNNEYIQAYGTHDGEIRFAQANGDHNPYRGNT